MKPAPKNTSTKALTPITQMDQDEQTFLQTTGDQILGFLKSIPAFLRRARELETEAKTALAEAKGFKAPTTGDEDAYLQSFIKTRNAHKKTTMETWDITAKIHALHRRMTAKRDITVTADEEGANIAQRLHNGWVEAERRRAQIEQDRLRQEAERKAREDRDRELAELERQALAAESSSGSLSDREQTFVNAVFAGQTGFNAAIRAGYKDAAKQASRLLETPKILKALEGLQTAQAVRQQAAAVKEEPLDVHVETVAPDIQKAAGAVDRTTWSAELLDERAFIEAVISGRFGVPLDCLTVAMPKLNELARSMQSQMDRIPGVRAKKTIRTV